jgi:hypothetical protein
MQYHGLKFQALVTPDGMLAHLYGPVSCRTTDGSMLAESGLPRVLKEEFKLPEAIRDDIEGELPSHWTLYGDPAYIPRSPYVMSPFNKHEIALDDVNGQPGLALPPGSLRAFNTTMSSLRISVEHWFSLLFNNFKYVVCGFRGFEVCIRCHRVALYCIGGCTAGRYLTYPHGLKLGSQPCGSYYVLCCDLINFMTIFRRGNQVSPLVE